jgi:3-oxoadipate enol-lactonase
MTARTLQVNGLAFHCRIEGREGAPWMVWSNSLLTDTGLWAAQVAAFGDRFRLLRYDQRGHGGTQVPSATTNFDELISDLAGLMGQLGIEGALVGGCSMGAATALGLAARHPALCAAVIASDGQAGTAPGGAQSWQERMDFARANGMAKHAEATLQRWFAPASIAEGNPAIPAVREMILSTPFDGFIACATALQSYDLRAEIAGIRQPALLIAGAQDGAMPQTMRGIAAGMPDARYVEIPEAGHLPCIERPGAFNAAVEAFLKQVAVF